MGCDVGPYMCFGALAAVLYVVWPGFAVLAAVVVEIVESGCPECTLRGSDYASMVSVRYMRRHYGIDIRTFFWATVTWPAWIPVFRRVLTKYDWHEG